MATALELATDRKHVELDEKENQLHAHEASISSAHGHAHAHGVPHHKLTLAEYMQQAQESRERERLESEHTEAGRGSSEGSEAEHDAEKRASESPTGSKRHTTTFAGAPIEEDELVAARRALRNASWAAVFFLITTDILGPFNAPYAFSQVGYVPGTILYLVMGAVACYTGLILWRLFCTLDSHVYPVKTYADIAERIIGKWFKHLCSVLQSLQLIINVGTLCLSNAQSVEQIAKNNTFCFSVAILMWALVGMVIGQIRTLKQYGWLANSAVWLNLLIIFITMGVVAHTPPNFKSAAAAYGTSPDPGQPIHTKAFVSLPLYSKVNGIMNMVFAYGGAMIFPEFMAEMKRPMDFWKGMCCAQLLIVSVYMMFGIFVYSFQGEFTLPLAYQGLSKFGWQTVGNVIALITGIIAAGLYGNIGIKVAYYHIIEQWLNGPSLMSRKGRVIWTFMVFFYWSLAFIVGSAIPQVQTISGLVAAVCIMQFTYTFPPLFYAIFHMQLDAARNDPGDSWREVSRWKRALLGSPSSPTANANSSSPGNTNGTPKSQRGFKYLKSAVLNHSTANTSDAQMALYKVFNIVLFLGSLAMACLGMYGSGKAIQQTFNEGGAATSFGCGVPV